MPTLWLLSYQLMALALTQLEDADNARAAYERAIALDPADPLTRLNYGGAGCCEAEGAGNTKGRRRRRLCQLQLELERPRREPRNRRGGGGRRPDTRTPPHHLRSPDCMSSLLAAALLAATMLLREGELEASAQQLGEAQQLLGAGADSADPDLAALAEALAQQLAAAAKSSAA